MKRKTVLSEASVEEILQSFTELGIVRKVSLPSPTTQRYLAVAPGYPFSGGSVAWRGLRDGKKADRFETATTRQRPAEV
jgi:hypothetical protein